MPVQSAAPSALPLRKPRKHMCSQGAALERSVHPELPPRCSLLQAGREPAAAAKPLRHAQRTLKQQAYFKRDVERRAMKRRSSERWSAKRATGTVLARPDVAANRSWSRRRAACVLDSMYVRVAQAVALLLE